MKEILINQKRVGVDGTAAALVKIREVTREGEVSYEHSGTLARAVCKRTRDGLWIFDRGQIYFAQKVKEKSSKGAGAHHGIPDGLTEIISPMPGKIFKILVSEGDEVKRGQEVIILEAMKMEHALCAPQDGKILLGGAKEGDLVQIGHKLAEIG